MAASCFQAVSYPKSIDFSELESVLEATKFDKRPVLICGGGGAVESYLSYQTVAMFDCKKAAVQVLFTAEVSKDQAKQKLREALRRALRGETGIAEPSCFPKPLWIRFGNSAFAVRELCNDFEGLPASIFRQAYSIDAACEDGLISDDEKCNLLLGGLDLGRWFDQSFAVWITTDFEVEEAKEHLQDAIPHFEHLGLIEVKVPEVAVTRVVAEHEHKNASLFADLPGDLQNSILEALHSGNEEQLAKSLAKATEARKCKK